MHSRTTGGVQVTTFQGEVLSNKATHQLQAPDHVSLLQLTPARAVPRRAGGGQAPKVSTQRVKKDGKPERKNTE